MLLIVGGESDPNTRRIVDQAHIRDLEYFFWDTDSSSSLQIAWDFQSPELDLGEVCLCPDAIYMRWNVFGGESTRNLSAYEMMQSYAFAWPRIRMLNRGSATDTNNKSLNLRLGRQVGFAIPETLVMSDLSPLKTMPDAARKIAKPLNGGIHTQRVSEFSQSDESLNTSPPMFIQECIEGENLRVFSVGGQLFGFHLTTTELDYRDDSTVGVHSIEVPPELIPPTHALVQQKQFDYCALDFRCRSKFEDPIFLEINSFPMFVRFDDACENQIADAVLDFLMEDSTMAK